MVRRRGFQVSLGELLEGLEAADVNEREELTHPRGEGQ